jgi:hypothetical protein
MELTHFKVNFDFIVTGSLFRNTLTENGLNMAE